jgi:photosystem II stability/assembly factor-like uncharacterized protein
MNKISKLLLIILFLYSGMLSGQWIIMDTIATAAYSFGSSGNYLYAGTNTNGFYYSLDSGVSWTPSNEGITHLNIRSISARDSLVFIGCEGEVYKSTDYGMSWTPGHNGITGLDICYTLFIGDSILIGSYGGGVFVSTDYGENFTPLNNGLLDHYVNSLLFNGTRLFAGIQYGGTGIWASDNNGATWLQKSTGLPKNPFNIHKYDDILSLTMTSQSIFASTFYNGVYKSNDNGETWFGVLPDDRATWNLVTREESVFSSHHSSNVYKSNDNGAIWELCDEGLYGGDVYGLYIYGDYIFAGTPGGYVFRRPLDELMTGIPQQKNSIDVAVYPNPVSGNSKIVIPYSHGDKYALEIYNQAGRLVKRISGLKGDKLELRKGDFSTGLYLFKITGSDNQSFTGKFIVH